MYQENLLKKINSISFRDVMVNLLYWEILVSEFELQSRRCIHFSTKTFGEGISIPSYTAAIYNVSSFFI